MPDITPPQTPGSSPLQSPEPATARPELLRTLGLLALGAAAAILAIAFLNGMRPYDDGAGLDRPLAAIQGELRRISEVEEAYYTQHGRYAPNVGALRTVYRAPASMTLSLYGNAEGWHARLVDAEHPAVGGCAVVVRRHATPIGDSAAAVAATGVTPPGGIAAKIGTPGSTQSTGSAPAAKSALGAAASPPPVVRSLFAVRTKWNDRQGECWSGDIAFPDSLD